MMENVINSIYGLKAINKAAAVVTGQAGCSDKLTDEQLKDSLSDRVGQLNKYFATCKLSKKHPERLAVVKEYELLSIQLKEVKARLKLKPRNCDISPFFLIVAKSNLSKFQYEKIMQEAKKMGVKYDWDTDAMRADIDNG